MEIVFLAAKDSKQAQAAADWYAELCQDAFHGAKPSAIHRSLMALDVGTHLTLNFDHLLEEAGARKVIHLHGSVGDPRSLVTTITQYDSGLPKKLSDQFRTAVKDKRVLVVGYSGRDRDVLPLLRVFKPSEIVWLKYPGSSLSAEVSELERERPLMILETTVEDYVESLGFAPNRDFTTRQAPNAPATEEHEPVHALPLDVAVDAVFEVLDQQVNPKLADGFIDLVEASGIPTSARFRRLRGRHDSQNHRARGALRSFLTPGSFKGNLNEIAALNTRKLGWKWPNKAMMLWGSRLGLENSRQTQLASLQRLSNQYLIEGRLDKALALDSNSEWLSEGLTSAQVRVSGLTFLSDRLRASGQLRSANLARKQALFDAPYTKVVTRAYLLMMISHGLLCEGDDKGCLEALDHSDLLLNRASGSATNKAKGLWNDMVRTNALMTRGDLESAEQLIPVMANEPEFESTIARPMLRLHQLELLACQGRTGDVAALLEDMIEELRGHKIKAPQIIKSAQLIALEVGAWEPSKHPEVWLNETADWFGIRGHGLCRVRAIGTLSHRYEKAFTAAHMNAWTAKGLNDAVTWAMHRGERLHWVLPF